jgi:hypothetical protein
MNEPTISLSLQLELIDDCLTGCVIDASGARREFMGRLGLLATIDALVDESQSSAFATGDDMRRRP